MDAQAFYDELGSEYDLMVPWEQRLARERAFFDRLFTERGVHRVLDAACGTGRHVIALARAGYECTGIDLSPVMVRRARENAKEAGVSPRFEVAPFGGIASRVGGGFDAVTCIGNSLPHLLDDASLEACLSDFADLLRAGGVLVIQNRNYDRLLRERRSLMPPVSRTVDGEETLFVRLTRYPLPGAGNEEAVEFTLLVLRRRGGRWEASERSTPLRALRRSTLERALSRTGFAAARAWGGYAREEFDQPGTTDLVMTADRAP